MFDISLPVRRLNMLPRWFSTILMYSMIILALMGLVSVGHTKSKFLAAEEAFSYQLINMDDDTLIVAWQIAPDYYLYRQRFRVKGVDAPITSVTYPKGEIITDEYYGETEVYFNHVNIDVIPDSATQLELSWQGCAKAGLCYPPESKVVDIANSAQSTTQPVPNRPSLFSSNKRPTHSLLDKTPANNDSISNDESRSSVSNVPSSQPSSAASSLTEPVTTAADKPKAVTPSEPEPLSTTLESAVKNANADATERERLPSASSETKDSQSNLTSDAISDLIKEEAVIDINKTNSRPSNNDIDTTADLTQDTDPATLQDIPASATLSNTIAPLSPPSVSPSAMTSDSPQADDQRFANRLAQSSFMVSIGIFFGLGILLVFTPCVLPMIPILSAVIVGTHANRGKALLLSSVFVLAMALTYALLGVGAAALGANLQALVQSPFFIVPFALIFVALALAMFGVYDLQLPAFVNRRLNQVSEKQSGGNLWGAATMGVLSALLASPCMTAPLAGALLYIADTGNLVFGGMALFALGLGMGFPLIILAVIESSLLPKPGNWMTVVKVFFGFVLLALAIYFLSRILPASYTLALAGALVLGLGVLLWQTAGLKKYNQAVNHIVHIASSGIIVWGCLMMIGAAAGGTHMTRPLAPLVQSTTNTNPTTSLQASTVLEFIPIKSYDDLRTHVALAAAQDKPVLVDFYADWCIACKVMEDTVFTQPEVTALMQQFYLLRADVTNNDATDQALMQQLQIVGPPTFVFYQSGQEVRHHRIVGEMYATEFLQRLQQVVNLQ